MRAFSRLLIGLVLATLAGTVRAGDPDPDRIRSAIQKALPPVQKGLAEFQARWVPPKDMSMPDHLKTVGCISCHHEGVGLSTLSLLRERGFEVDRGVLGMESRKLASAYESFAPLYRRALTDREAAAEADFFGDISVQIGYMLGGLLDAGHAPDAATEAAARVLMKFQQEDGSWTSNFDREPMQMSDFAATAMAARVLRAYKPQADSGAAEQSLAKARGWLESNRPATTDDLVYRLLGLAWTGSSEGVRAEATHAIRAAQRSDGGWAQLASSRESDAYATSLALIALHRGGGVPAEDPAFRRGISFLLSTQRADGTWFVRKWSHAYNGYFDAGFPYGKNQFISLPATCYAMTALSLACEPKAGAADRKHTAAR
ncbi:MAG: prenyltransferase/squalene oxidase repeat-containing protein [Isosphaeraceae bacterium]